MKSSEAKRLFAKELAVLNDPVEASHNFHDAESLALRSAAWLLMGQEAQLAI